MKDAAKCDNRREWQNSANQQKAERNLQLCAISTQLCLFQGSNISAFKIVELQGSDDFGLRGCALALGVDA